MRISTKSRLTGYFVGISGVLAIACVLWLCYPKVEPLTAAMAQLLVVVAVATAWGTGPSLVASGLGAIVANFYFVPPSLVFRPRMAEGSDLVALVAYSATSVLVGQLWSREQSKTKQLRDAYQRARTALQYAKQMDAIRESERLKTALLDTVTHDLRTPLTSIKAAATALHAHPQKQSPCESEDELVEIIIKQCDRLDGFIDSLIEYARVQADSTSCARDLRKTRIEEIVDAALRRAEDTLRGHSVFVSCNEDLVLSIAPHAIAQVLFSLLENAARYSPPGSKVIVNARAIEGNAVEIAVEDEGTGIKRELRDRVFEKFFRANTGHQDSANGVGLGLGLSIARAIVVAHGGRIWVEDRQDRKPGARVVFTIPSAERSDHHDSQLLENRHGS